MSVMVHPLGLRDFTWVWGADPLISRTPLSVFEKYRVTGFEVKPVNVTYPKGIKARPPELFELIVTGWGGLPAPSAGLSVIESCRDCGHTVYAIAEPSQLIDATAWDGSDLFIVWPLPGFPLVSDRVADIIRHEQVSGVKLVPAQEIRLKRGDTVTPGPLNMHMPEDRARELCKRFGI